MTSGSRAQPGRGSEQPSQALLGRAWEATERCYLPRAALLLSLSGSLLAGCSSLPSSINPVEWWHGLEGGAIAEQRPPPPGANEPYPNLATVPEKPAAMDAAARERIAQALIADRTNAQHAAAAAPLADPSSRGCIPGPLWPRLRGSSVRHRSRIPGRPRRRWKRQRPRRRRPPRRRPPGRRSRRCRARPSPLRPERTTPSRRPKTRPGSGPAHGGPAATKPLRRPGLPARSPARQPAPAVAPHPPPRRQPRPRNPSLPSPWRSPFRPGRPFCRALARPRCASSPPSGAAPGSLSLDTERRHRAIRGRNPKRSLSA